MMAVLLSLGLTGCATGTGTGLTATDVVSTGANVGTALFQTAVNQKCQSELTANKYWQAASMLMTAETKTKVATNVCGCVSEKAPQSVTMADLATAAIDTTARTQVAAKAVSNTLQACVSEYVGTATK